MTNTRSTNAKGAPKAAPRSLLISMAIVLLLIGIAWWFISSMLADVTGEYSAYVPRAGQVNMSISHGEVGTNAELSYGDGPMLESTISEIDENGKFNCVFTVPEKWINYRHHQRKVNFHGSVTNGTITGVIQEGRDVTPVKLERSIVSTLYQQIQAHR